MPQTLPFRMCLKAARRLVVDKLGVDGALQEEIKAAGLKMVTPTTALLTITGKCDVALCSTLFAHIITPYTKYHGITIEVKSGGFDYKTPITGPLSVHDIITKLVSELPRDTQASSTPKQNFKNDKHVSLESLLSQKKESAQKLEALTTSADAVSDTLAQSLKELVNNSDGCKANMVHYRKDALSVEIQQAIEAHDFDKIKEFFIKGVSEILLEDQCSALFKTITQSDIEVAGYLIAKGVDVNISNASKITALDLACARNDIKMVEFLLQQKNIIFNEIGILGLSPLQTAADAIVSTESFNAHIIRKILEKYQESEVDVTEEVLLSVDRKLQHSSSYALEDYRSCVQELFGRDSTAVVSELDW